jgi:uncharacterized OsmC-like protein
MNQEQLRQTQQPLKQKYRENPEAAIVEFKSTCTLQDNASCLLSESKRQPATAGLHPATGGDGSLLCSADMLLEALVACAGVTLQAVATNMGAPLLNSRVTAEGTLDFRGTLGVDKSLPVGFTHIKLLFDIGDDLEQSQKELLIRTTEKYCVVFQTLKSTQVSSELVRPKSQWL